MEMNAGVEDAEVAQAFGFFGSDGAALSAEAMHKTVQQMGHDLSKEEIQNMIKTVGGGDTLDFETFKKMMTGKL